MEIEKMNAHPIKVVDNYGNEVESGVTPPTGFELMEKVNEMIDYLTVLKDECERMFETMMNLNAQLLKLIQEDESDD